MSKVDNTHHICLCGNQMALVREKTEILVALYGCHDCNLGFFKYDRNNIMFVRLSNQLALEV